MRFASALVIMLCSMTVMVAGGTYASAHVISQPVPAADPVLLWSDGAPSPIVRAEAERAAIGNKLYVFGGYSYPLNGFTPYSRVDVFDASRNAWTRLRDLPRAVNHAGVAVDGTTVYLAGGYVANASGSGAIFGTREVWRYDSTTDSYAAMPPLPIERAAGQLVLVGRTLHFFGGTNQQRTVDTSEHWSLSLAGGTTWQPRARLPNSRNHLGGVALDGLIYAIGGQHGHDDALTTQRDVHRYDPRTDRWTAVAPLPAVVVGGTSYGRGHISASTFVRDGRIVVAGGEYDHMRPLRDVVEYDPATNRWTAQRMPLPAARYSGVAAQLGSTFVYATGARGGAQLTNTTWLGCYDSATPPSGVDYCAKIGPVPRTWRINAGGYAQTVGGTTWSVCRDVSSCKGWVSGGKRYIHNPAPSISGVVAPANAALYQTEWTGDPAANVPAGGVAFSFNLPVVNGVYTIRLHFAENYQNAAGARTFDVNLEGGATELADFDVYAAAGGKNTAMMREFPITVSDGVASIDFVRQVQQPFVNAIEVLPAANPSQPTSTPSLQPTATGTITPSPSPTAPPTATPTPQQTSLPTSVPSGQSSIHINMGGYAQTVQGTSWSACRDVAGCSGWVTGGRRYTHSPAPAVSGVVAPANVAIYQAEWTEDAAAKIVAGSVAFSFAVPVTNGSYTVRLHFAENVQTAAGARTFDVTIEGVQQLTTFDMFVAAGGKHIAVVRDFPVTITDGTVNIQFIKQVEQPFVNGIEIVPSGAG